MHKQSAAVLVLLASSTSFLGCAARPVIETYTIDSGANAVPPARSVQYFLPLRLVAVTVQRTRTRRDTITIRTLAPVPDLAHPYYAYVRASPLRDETSTVRTTAAGLLSSFSSSSKDETPAILIDAVALAGLVPQLAAVEGALGGGPGQALRLPRGPGASSDVRPCGLLNGGLPASSQQVPAAFKATVIIDPTSPGDLARAEAELCTRGAHFRFVTVPVAPMPAPAALRSGAAKCDGTPVVGLRCEPLLYYRRDQPYLLTIYDAAEATAAYTLVSAALVQTPNASPIERLSFTTSAAVSTRQSAQFSDGMLLSTSSARPSPVLALASLPLQIAKAIVSIPSALFQFRIDSTRDQARLSQAQTEAIKAETARLNALAALQAKEASPGPDASDSVSGNEDSDLQR